MSISNLVNFLNPGTPKGLARSAPQWVRQRLDAQPQLRQPRPEAWIKEVFAAEEGIHTLRRASEPSPYEEFAGVRWTVTPAAWLFYAKGCRVLGDEGAVISPDNKLFAEFTMPPADRWLDHSAFKRRRMPAAKPLKGWYATIAWPESKFFFHWMIESLPRMAVLGERAKILDGIFVPSPVQRFHRESLRLLGIDEAKLIPLDVNSHYAPEHLFVPRAFSLFNPPRWLHAWFKSAYLGPARDGGGSSQQRRIYVSRDDAPVRRVVNESDVRKMLDHYGFTTVRLSELPFEEQARLFNEADAIVAAHGAGLSNTVFCKPDTLLIEVLPPRWMPPCFMALASSAGCRYRHLVAEEVAGAQGGDAQKNHTRIPLDELEAVLQAALQ
jgi:capsular polysaccharide biosynthesis protein